MAYEYGRSESRESGCETENVYIKTLAGQSILENKAAVWTAGNENNPFVVFHDSKNGKKIGLNKSVLSKGVLALGAPGGGKTNLFQFILSRLLDTQESEDIIIILDTKGDYLADFGDKISAENRYIIGTGEEYKSITCFHNIFSEIMPEGVDGRLVYTPDSDIDALEIAKQLFQNMDSESQPIFPAMSRLIVSGLLIYFMRTYWYTDQTKLNNKEFSDFLKCSTNIEIRQAFEKDYMRDQKSLLDYIAKDNNQTQGVNSYIGAVCREMFIGPFAQCKKNREFSMQKIVKGRGKKVVFIEYDLRRGQVLSPMYGILIERALVNALGGREKSRKNVYFLLDEMALLPRLEHMSSALNFGRSQGIKILAGLQNISAVEEVYGEAGVRNILAGFQNIFAFRLTDYDTCQFLIKRLGENYQNFSFTAQQKNLYIQRNGHTVEDWQILNMEFGESIVSLACEKPFLFHMPKYDR